MDHTSYKYITGAATTTFAGNESTRVFLHAINVNKLTIGTVTIQSDTTVLGILAAGTPIGQYWVSTRGLTIPSLTIVNAAAENITVEYATF